MSNSFSVASLMPEPRLVSQASVEKIALSAAVENLTSFCKMIERDDDLGGKVKGLLEEVMKDAEAQGKSNRGKKRKKEKVSFLFSLPLHVLFCLFCLFGSVPFCSR